MNFNDTTIFLFPLLGIPKLIFSKGHETRYINSFLRDDCLAKYGHYHLFITHKNFQDTQFKAFEDSLTSLDNYVDEYDICNNEVGVKIFKIPEEHIDDYHAFIEGRYSDFSKEAQEKVLTNNFSIISSAHIDYLKQVFNKCEILRDFQEKKVGQSIFNQDVRSVYNKEKNVLTKNMKKILSSRKKLEAKLGENEEIELY